MKKTKSFYYALLGLTMIFMFTFYVPAVKAAIYSDNIIPGSGGTASTPYYRSGHTANLAFDGDYNTFWEANFAHVASLTYEFPAPRTVTRTKVVQADPSYHVWLPNDWIFSGSNDGIHWDVLGTTNVGITDDSFTDNVTNATAYKFYKFDFTEWTRTDEWGGIAEVEMFETITDPQYSTNIVPGSGGTGSTPYYRSGHTANFAFDGDYNTFWEADFAHVASLTYEFPTPRAVTRTKVVQADPSYHVWLPNDWIFSGSNDGIHWNVLGTTNVGITDDSFTDNVTNSTAYKFYKFDFTEWTRTDEWGGIAEVEMFETIS